MNLNYKRKRRIAWILTVSIIILSVFILGGWKLESKRTSVQNYFFDGKNGFSIANDINVRRECGYNLLTIGERVKADPKKITALKDAISVSHDAMTVREYFEANTALTNAFDSLYSHLLNSDISQEDKRLSAKQSDEFESREKTIQKDLYNEKALAFNETIAKFPANLIAILSGINRVELFRNGG